ncbi:MAG TPA: RodZ domain-containing protein [Dongiaceae bacterium]|nr:RodZ domain-containing protein [Dongiaceae bacterium]
MAKGTFGERLKRERELREVTLDEVSSATRIAPRFLEALENEQWERLPGGVFGRGFVRSIARYLGLSEENLLAEYDLARGETANASAQKPEERIPSPPRWIPALVVVLIFALLAGLAAGGFYGWRWYQARRAAHKTSEMVKLPLQPVGQSNATPPAATPAEGLPASPATTLPRDVTLNLSVAASAATRLRVVADGVVVLDAEIASGENRRFSAKDSFEVSAADSSAVLLELNGQTVPPLGAPGSSGKIVLTAKDLGQATGGNSQP